MKICQCHLVNLEAVLFVLLLLYAATNKMPPSSNISKDFLNWLGISPSVEKASTHIFVCWIAPPMYWAKLNFDGASKGNPGHAGGGGIFRNNSGKLVFAYANYYGTKTSCEAEARAKLDGLRLAKGKGIFNLWLEIDSFMLVHMLQVSCEIPWNILYIFREINSLLPPSFIVSHIYRNGNQGADFMANWVVNAQSNLYFEDAVVMPE